MIVKRLAILTLGAAAIVVIGVATGVITTPATDAARQSFSARVDAALSNHTEPLDTGHASISTTQQRSIAEALAHVRVVDTLPTVPGYERSCRKNKGCVFGPAWTDDTDAPLSRNGCDTRNDILRTQLADVRTGPKTHDCKVISGRLNPDPYTGQPITLAKTSSGSNIEIDHVFALELAWNSGAAAWTPQRRATFANDPANLLAVDANNNSGKGSKSIAEWLPPNASFRCSYIDRYLAVAASYQLPITASDKHTAERTCPTIR